MFLFIFLCWSKFTENCMLCTTKGILNQDVNSPRSLCITTSCTQNSPTSIVYANYSQTSSTSRQFFREYSFQLCCFGKSLMIKFTSLTCIFKARLGCETSQPDVNRHKGYCLCYLTYLIIKWSAAFWKLQGKRKLVLEIASCKGHKVNTITVTVNKYCKQTETCLKGQLAGA